MHRHHFIEPPSKPKTPGCLSPGQDKTKAGWLLALFLLSLLLLALFDANGPQLQDGLQPPAGRGSR
jgi:hypothetical protein